MDVSQSLDYSSVSDLAVISNISALIVCKFLWISKLFENCLC